MALSCKVDWALVTTNSGGVTLPAGSINGYEVEITDGLGVVSTALLGGTSSTFTKVGLPSGNTSARVRARNANGLFGAFSPATATILVDPNDTPPAAPGAPTVTQL